MKIKKIIDKVELQEVTAQGCQDDCSVYVGTRGPAKGVDAIAGVPGTCTDLYEKTPETWYFW